MLHFKNIVVKTPCSKIVDGLADNNETSRPDYKNALKQHINYIDTLKGLGLKVEILNADEQYPDSCFIEDTAVVVPNVCAVITNPGAPSRNLETVSVALVLEKYFDKNKIFRITSPGTLDGGDVMMVDDTYFVGMSKRTNLVGIEQFTKFLGLFNKKVIAVKMDAMLHLKSGVNYLQHNNLLITGEFVDNSNFANFNKIVIPADEAYGANCIWINDTVIVPKGYPKTKKLIEDLKIYKVVEVDTSEYKKVDGGLSCLSLRF